MSNYLLSICLITYNQERFVAKSIQSVFEQNIHFPVEFIISNDCSTDNTHQVILENIKNVPENFTVKYHNHTQNLGMMRNFIFSVSACTGKYIAYFEGDDYWDFPNKINTQINYLEANKDCVICFHNLKILEDNVVSTESYIDKLIVKDISTIEDLALNNFIPTLTAVFRNVQDKFPENFENYPIADFPMFMKISQRGNLKFINKKWAVYRKNVGEWSKMANKQNEKMIYLYDSLLQEFSHNPTVKRNLNLSKIRYIKGFFQNESLSYVGIFQHKYFQQLNVLDRVKILIKKLIA